MFATIAGGALLLPSLIQLVLVGGGLWLGASVAQQLFGGGGGEGGPRVSPDGTIDVEAETVDDRDWRDEVLKCVQGAGEGGRAAAPRRRCMGRGVGAWVQERTGPWHAGAVLWVAWPASVQRVAARRRDSGVQPRLAHP